MCINSFNPHDNPTRWKLELSCSAVSDSLRPTRILCPWNFPGKSTEAGCPFLLQGIFPTKGSNLRLLHWQADSLPLRHLWSPHQTDTVIIFTCQIRKLRHWEVRPQGYTTGRRETWHLSLPLTPIQHWLLVPRLAWLKTPGNIKVDILKIESFQKPQGPLLLNSLRYSHPDLN